MKFAAYIWSIILLIGIMFTSCERDDDERDDSSRFEIDTTNVYVDNAYENKLKDSVWYYFRVLSLWENVLTPTNFDLHKMDSLNYLKDNYTKYFQTPGDIIGYLKYLTKASVVGNSVSPNAGSGNNYSFYEDILYSHKKGESRAYDWYSFLDRGGFVSGALQKGYLSGYGMDLSYLQTNPNSSNANLYIRFVEKNSVAYKAGLRRGHQIISLDDDTKIDYDSQKGNNFNTLNNYLYNSTLKVEYKTPEGQTHVANLEYAYNRFADPIFVDTVLDLGTQKVGYIGISSFLSSNALITDKGEIKLFQTRIQDVFNKLSTSNIKDLVVDLRYNGGGSVYTAEILADYMAPNSASGNLMYTNKINAILKQAGFDEEGQDFGPIDFSKKGNLNLSKIYFLVSDETASASEMLINVLSPHMQVYMIGTYKYENNKTVANNTYGKPVGFFPQEIVSSNNLLYVISFQMFNKDKFGDYFDGLKPNTNVWEYKSFLDFGNKDESMLAAALDHIRTGSFSSTVSRSVLPNTNLERKFSRDNVGTRKIQGMFKFPTKKIHL
ncbi:MAG: S41 family peptidase [Sphingobacterium composti]